MNPIPSLEDSKRGLKADAVIGYFRKRQENCGQASPYRLTASGAWAASRPEYLSHFFERLNLGHFRLFIDLGSGDGVACCLAGLFTRAIGIESDHFLASGAERTARDLELQERVSFICADFLTQSIQRADCLYIYPDKPLDALEKVLGEWNGNLLVYGPHFPPKHLVLQKKLRLGMETMSVYCCPKSGS
ncbi:MAG: hypothetical protein ACP5IL_15145 [Syntrophobacteraceae bacterium]